MKTFIFSTRILLFAAACISTWASDISGTITHQGIMFLNDGTPVENGIYVFTLSIYDEETSGTPFWTETQEVEIADGIYTVQLGIVEPLDLPFDTQYWIGISVNSNDELNPRIPLSSVPYAFHAQSVSDGSITSSKLADESVTQEKLHPDISLPISGIAGGDLTGTYPNPTIASGAVNTTKLTDGAATTSKIADNAVTTAKISDGVVTTEKIQNNAVTATKIANGAVTSGKLDSNINISTTGTIEASSLIGDGSQITGIQTDEIALPFSGETSTTGSSLLIRNTGNGSALRGEATTSSGSAAYGVHGISQSTDGRGVLGVALAQAGKNTGISGLSLSNAGSGVRGEALASSGVTYGVFGRSASPAGRGVQGEHVSGTYGRLGTWVDGVVGRSNHEDGYGMYGIQGAGSHAGYFNGRVHISGNLSKGGGSFEIDHPLDPENMLLRHSFVESPDMMNIYNGNIITDGNGEAIIQLPDYFETLNRNIRYQLTVIGEFAQAIVAEEVSNNRFTIRTDKPEVKVSWQVTGIRKDRWAEENRIVVEEYKSPEIRGFYLHPDLFGQPETRSMEWGLRPEHMLEIEEERGRVDIERQKIREEQQLLNEEIERQRRELSDRVE